MSIDWTVDNELLNKRYDAAEKMFAERYGEDIAGTNTSEGTSCSFSTSSGKSVSKKVKE